MAHIHEHELGLTWVMEEAMERGSHALADGGRVWLIDPVDDQEAMERAAALGTAVGVIQLLDRHDRDCAAIAARLEVPHLRLPELLPDTPLEPRWVVRGRLWNEVALWWPARRALVVSESLGTTMAFAVGDGPIGVHPLRRLTPPRVLAGLAPEHVLFGHGPPLHGPQVAAQVDHAVDRSRADLPRLLLRMPALIRAAIGH